MLDETTPQREPDGSEFGAGASNAVETDAPAGAPLPASQAQTPVAKRRGRWLALALLVVGVGIVVLFGVRTVRAWRHFHDVRGRPMAEDLSRLRPWMTLPDVARDFVVPLESLYAELDVEPRTPDRRTLRDLNRQFAQGQRGYFEDKVRDVIEEYRRTQAPAAPPALPPPDLPPPDLPPANPDTPQGGSPDDGAGSPARPTMEAVAAATAVVPASSHEGGAL